MLWTKAVPRMGEEVGNPSRHLYLFPGIPKGRDCHQDSGHHTTILPAPSTPFPPCQGFRAMSLLALEDEKSLETSFTVEWSRTLAEGQAQVRRATWRGSCCRGRGSGSAEAGRRKPPWPHGDISFHGCAPAPASEQEPQFLSALGSRVHERLHCFGVCTCATLPPVLGALGTNATATVGTWSETQLGSLLRDPWAGEVAYAGCHSSRQE